MIREAMIKVLRYKADHIKAKIEPKFFAEVADVLEKEAKTGHWIDDKCSVCGKGTEDLVSSSEWYRNKEPNFCPFCGARLVESHVEGDE